jgi:hypothetical protein
MAAITYYVVQPFRMIEGELVPGEPMEKRSADLARSAARMIGLREGDGAVAFSRSGDPQLGDFEDAVVIARAGLVPESSPQRGNWACHAFCPDYPTGYRKNNGLDGTENRSVGGSIRPWAPFSFPISVE